MAVPQYFADYGKHAVLNFGQALQGIRHFFSHPDADASAPRGTIEHLTRSVRLRSRLVANDLVFAALPPQWHHTPEELGVMKTQPLHKWFQYGYCAWKFDEHGNVKPDLTGVDQRWDPRCNAR